MAEILIVDDDKILDSMLTKRLSSIGHSVTCITTRQMVLILDVINT